MKAEPPPRALHHQRNRLLQCCVAFVAIQRLNKKMIELPAFQLRRVDAVLRPDQLQFVAAALLKVNAGPVGRALGGLLRVTSFFS